MRSTGDKQPKRQSRMMMWFKEPSSSLPSSVLSPDLTQILLDCAKLCIILLFIIFHSFSSFFLSTPFIPYFLFITFGKLIMMTENRFIKIPREE